MAVGDAYVFPGFLTPVLTLLFFPKPPTTFLTCFCRGERRKYAGKKSRLNWGSNLQPPGQESDTLTTEPPGRGLVNTDLGPLLCRFFFKKQKVSAKVRPGSIKPPSHTARPNLIYWFIINDTLTIIWQFRGRAKTGWPESRISLLGLYHR